MQVEHSVQEDRISQAREHYAWFQQCFVLGIVWVVIFFAVAVVTLLPVIIVLAVS
jgi:uncharacterized membrane protein